LASVGQTVLKLSLLLYFSLLPFYGLENQEWRKSDVTGINVNVGPEQNDAGLESISQTGQQLKHFQLLAFRNSRWQLAPKIAKFFLRRLARRILLSAADVELWQISERQRTCLI
jgi:hypothetical protein